MRQPPDIWKKRGLYKAWLTDFLRWFLLTLFEDSGEFALCSWSTKCCKGRGFILFGSFFSDFCLKIFD